MIRIFTGTMGSGKSLHMALEIYRYLHRGKTVISNFPIYEEVFYKNVLRVNFKKKPYVSMIKIRNDRMGSFHFLKESVFTVNYLVKYAMNNHKRGIENQTLITIDEAQLMFNCREYARKDRKLWNKFFTQHRKLGYTVIMTCPYSKMLDKQIREISEYVTKHKCVNNFKVGMMLPIKVFVATEVWTGNNMRNGSEFFVYNDKYGKNFYDSYKIFDLEELLEEIKE